MTKRRIKMFSATRRVLAFAALATVPLVGLAAAQPASAAPVVTHGGWIAPASSGSAVPHGAVPRVAASGYDMVGSDGGVFVFGSPGGFFGSLPGLGVRVNNVVGMVGSFNGQGYFLVGSDGGVFSFGDTTFEGSLPGIGVHVNNIVGLVPSSDDKGYFLVGADGGVFNFGTAPAAQALTCDTGPGTCVPLVSIVSTSTGQGLWITDQWGDVFTYGDANNYGDFSNSSTGPTNIVSLVPGAGDQGYLLVGSDGGIFSFGQTNFFGSLPGIGVSVNNIVGAVATHPAVN